MSEHLPECLLGHPCQSGEPDHVMQGTIAGIPVTLCGLCMADCICDRLRACEQRVLSLNPVGLGVLIAQRARERALDAAREAVIKMDLHSFHPFRNVLPCNCIGPQIIASIDALREQP